MIRMLIFLVGTFIRNKKIFSSYQFLKKSDNWSLEKLEHYQLQKCKELLQWAYNNSEFYRKKFDEHKVNPSHLRSLSDLKKFPITTKTELLSFNKEIQITHGFKKLFFSETSGSTGEPLIFYRDDEWDARHRAAIFRGYSWYGVKPWEKNGYFWGYNIDPKKQRKIKLLDWLVNRFRIFSYKDDEIIDFVRKLKKAKFLEGYSSMIYEVAKIINQKGIKDHFNLKMIKGTSEKIFDKYQDEVKKAFGKKIISEYGAAEAGIIAFECPRGNMHIVMENVIVEEENGQIVVTNLVSKSFPIIRYKLGDYIKINTEKKCECGRKHYIIEDVMGRVGKNVRGFKNNYPSLTFYYVFKNLAIDRNIILNYQIHQYQVGYLTVLIEQKLNDYQKRLLQAEFQKYFQEDILVEIRDGEKICRENGKMRDFISHIE
jgi:phenylacetate-CoA ligase